MRGAFLGDWLWGLSSGDDWRCRHDGVSEQGCRYDERESSSDETVCSVGGGHGWSPKYQVLVRSPGFSEDTKDIAGGVPNLKNGGILRFTSCYDADDLFMIPKGWDFFPRVGIGDFAFAEDVLLPRPC